MNSEIQQRILGAVFACLVPLARLLLRYGITYRQFADIAKAAYVREAFAETDQRGRHANASRVAVRTGISRKEVSRLRDQLLEGADSSRPSRIDQYGPPARVLHAWHADPQFLESDGTPRALDFEGTEPSFVSLVRTAGGDVPPGAVRAELRRAGAIAETEGGRLTVTKRFYVPGNVDEKAITALSSMLFPFAAGLDHNSNPDRRTDGFIQRIAYTEKLDYRLVPTFRTWSRGEAIRFVESIDDWLARHESEPESERPKGAPRIVGMGVFYYEGPTAEEVARGGI